MNRNVTSTVLIIIAIGIYFTVTSNIITEGQAVLAVNNQYSSALKSAEELIKSRDKVNDDYKNISDDDHAKIDKMMPKTVDNIRLIIDLNNVALKHGFSLKDIKATTDDKGANGVTPAAAATPAVPLTGTGSTGATSPIPTITAPVLDTVTVSFSLEAPYQQFISFMQDLEANMRISDITKLEVTSNDNGIYGWTVTLQTYWLKKQ